MKTKEIMKPSGKYMRTIRSMNNTMEGIRQRRKSLVISPGTWPGGEAGHEYRGIQLMLKEAHIQFDIIEDSQIANRAEALNGYKVVILPGISRLDSSAIETLNAILKQGTNIIATNTSFADNPTALTQFFGAKAIQPVHDGAGFYLNPDNKELFKRFDQQTLLFWKFNLGLYDFSAADTALLPILTPGRPGPPEIIGGHEPTGHYGMGVKVHGANKAILLPMNLGRLYFIHGYEQHKNILLDALEYAFPEVGQLVQTNAPPRVEVILQQFSENKPENLNSSSTDGMILHLVNLTGFSGNTYFDPLPVSNISFNIKTDFKPSRIFSMASEKTIDFKWDNGNITLSIERLEQYEGLVIEK